MLIVQEFVSVDGFAADRDGDFSFADVVADWSPLDAEQLRLMDRTGMIVLGRGTYELFVSHWPTADHVMADAINTTPKAVISRSLATATWGRWPAPIVRHGPLDEAIRDLTAAAAPKDLLVWGSLGLTRSLLRERLVDELRLIVCPVALGAGIAVTPADLDRTTLDLRQAKSYSNGAVQLTYRT